MILVTTDDLRNLIALKVNETIAEYRMSKRAEYDPCSMAGYFEIDGFIRTNPYYDTQLKEFLLQQNEYAIFVSEVWFGTFYSAITHWYDSEEWLDYPPDLFEEALLSYEDGVISRLGMPSG